MKRLLSQLENVAKMTTSLTSTLMLIGSGRVARMDIPSLSKKIEEVHNLSEILPILSRWIDASLKEYSMKSSNGADLVTKQEAEIMTQLKKAIDVLSLNFTDLYPVAKQIIINCSNSSHNRLNISVLNSGSANLSSLVLLAGKCLKVNTAMIQCYSEEDYSLRQTIYENEKRFSYPHIRILIYMYLLCGGWGLYSSFSIHNLYSPLK